MFTETPAGNFTLERDGFFISFLPHLAGILGGSVLGAPVGGETALVKKGPDRKYYILNGDFRKDYEGIVDQGWDACFKFFESQKDEHQSIWSN